MNIFKIMYRLDSISTKAPGNFDKKETKEKTAAILEELDALQNVLYASSNTSVLVILQGMDASGKDGVIRKVFGQLNPQGVQVKSFKAPTDEEKSHDFLWRIHQHTPAKGMIQIFNRSHYEDVLITRVHGWCDDKTAQERFGAINNFEQLLAVHNNTVIFKFYLHVSPEEQKSRLEERVEDPTKQWKYNSGDFKEAKHWEKYRQMYEAVFENCNAIPWTIVPADQNWYKEHIIAQQVTERLRGLKLEYPTLEETKKQ
jgi:PPK2 family polyphosphate:nucleotide phosphotransferase